MADDTSNRLKLAGNKFVAADLQVPAANEPVAVETVDPQTVALADDRTLYAEPLTSVVEPGTEPASLPVVQSDETPDSGGLFPDRNDEERFWHLPGYEVGLPADGPLFDCTVAYRGPNASGEQVTRYRGTIQVSYETVATYDEESWQSKKPGEDATLSAVPLELETADLDLTYVEDGETTTRRIQGTINRANDRIQFEPQGDFLKVAYQNLAREGASATLVVRGRFEAWRERSDEEEVVVNPALVRPVMPTELIEPIPEIRTPVGLNQRVGDGSRLRTDGGDEQPTATLEFGPNPVISEQVIDPVEIDPVQIENLPETEAEDATYVRQQFSVEQELALEFPCRDHPDQYAEADGGVTSTFGCTPPWDSGYDPAERYDRLALDWLPEGVTVYGSRAETDRFLLVPSAYVIARDRGSNVPLVSVVNATDPTDDAASSVRLDLTVGPDLTTFERALIEQGLYEHTTDRNGEPAEPVVELPTTVPAVSTGIDWQGGLAESVTTYPNGVGHTLGLTYESLTDAAIALEQLRGDHGAALGGRATIDSEGQDLGSAAIVADVNRTAGPVLATTYPAEEGGVSATNDCESPVRIERFLFYTEGQPGYEVVEVQPRTVASGGTVRFADAEPDGDFEVATPDYEIAEKPDRALDEDFVEIDHLEAIFSVTARLDAASRGVEKLEVAAIFPPTDARETRTLEPDGGNFGAVSETVTFTLPITTYLEPSKREAKFRATVVYEDGRSDHLSPWRRIDLAETSRISFDAEMLGLEGDG